MNKVAIGIVVAAVVIGGAWIYSSNRSAEKASVRPETNGQEVPLSAQSMPEANNAAPVESSSEKITVALNALNNSGESGVAVLEDLGGRTRVELKLTGAPQGTPQPAHIHMGSCPGVGAIKYPLTSVINGESVTEISVPLSQILSELPLAVNVHKSAAEASVYYSCGEIVAPGMSVPSSQAQPSAGTGGAIIQNDDRNGGGTFSTPTDRRRGADKPED